MARMSSVGSVYGVLPAPSTVTVKSFGALANGAADDAAARAVRPSARVTVTLRPSSRRPITPGTGSRDNAPHSRASTAARAPALVALSTSGTGQGYPEAGYSGPVVTRLAAGVAAIAIAAGAIIFWLSVVQSQGFSYAGYISETGVPGSPQALGYRVGIALFSCGLLLLGVALRHTLPFAAGLLALGGLLSSAASVVNCSAGCPLPPYEAPTFGDLVHAGASVGAVVACLAAMVVFAVSPTVGVERALCRAWLVAALPLFLVAASSLLFVGRGRLTGDSERVLLVVIIVCALVLALLQTRRIERPTQLSDMSK